MNMTNTDMHDFVLSKYLIGEGMKYSVSLHRVATAETHTNADTSPHSSHHKALHSNGAREIAFRPVGGEAHSPLKPTSKNAMFIASAGSCPGRFMATAWHRCNVLAMHAGNSCSLTRIDTHVQTDIKQFSTSTYISLGHFLCPTHLLFTEFLCRPIDVIAQTQSRAQKRY